jgi:hypothetical protein
MSFTSIRSVPCCSNRTLKHWNLGPLLRTVQRGELRHAYEVGVEDAGLVAVNEGLCVCTVEFLGHMVHVRLCFLCFLWSLLGLVILHSLRRKCLYLKFFFFKMGILMAGYVG